MKQKRIALVNDITGFGRCSIAVELPIISAMKIQACPLPTAILSVHTGFPNHFLDDYTNRMREYVASWEKNQLTFDGIATGFLSSVEQIEIVIDFIKKFRTPETKIFVDPVMGDDGKLYQSYTKEICREMRKLLQYADLVTPNLTEACELLGIEYPENVSEDQIWKMAEEISNRGSKDVIITGVRFENLMKNFILSSGNRSIVESKKIDGDRSGTGDAFAAIVSASILNGEDLRIAVEKAQKFIAKSISYAVELDLPWNWGLPIEEFLTELR
ncbi:MAG: pyridoxamine kinase [Selenomonadaceae bacterium]|nr:pyridoxamine kinase [Selenomonadaceae bacterium]